jgi:hypothetical protein
VDGWLHKNKTPATTTGVVNFELGADSALALILLVVSRFVL